MNAYSPDNHKWRVLGVIIFVYVFLCFLLAIPAEALRLRTNWAKRVDLSKNIIRGEVVSLKSYWNPERTLIYTDITLLVDDHIKGDGSGETTITVPGGTVGDDTHWVSDTPHFDVGDYGIILLEPFGYVTGGPDGVYLIQRPIGGTNQLQSVTEDRFLLWIKSYVNGQTQISFEESAEESSMMSMEQNISYATISGVNPSTISAGTGSVLTVTGNGFGSSRGSGDYPTIGFRYKDISYMVDNSKIISWSDSQIQVEVFTDIIGGYPYSPGSWSNTVALINSARIMDSFYALDVPFGHGQAKWTTPSVPYYINPTGGLSGSETALQAAANTWNGAGADFSFNYGGSTSSGWGQDGQNVLSFADLGSSSIIAQATTYYTGGIVSESDIQFNTGFNWSTDTPTPGDKMDLQSIAVHELGHWLQLLDLYGTNDATKVMYGFGSYGAMKRNLTSGDQAGIQWIYPTGGNCSYSVSPTTQSFSASGGTGTINVTTNSNCSWTASTNSGSWAWIAITSGWSGTGSGPVNYMVLPNYTGTSRSGYLTIAGQTFNITQTYDGGCTIYTLSKPSQTFGSGAGSGSVNVTTGANCPWTASTNSGSWAWIAITSGWSGTGSGQVNYMVLPNNTGSSRSGYLTIAGQTFTITQTYDGDCTTYTLSKPSQTFGPGAGSGSVNVTAGTNCPWTASTNSGSWDWIAITSGWNGTGSGPVNYMVLPNYTGTSRSGYLTIAGQTFNIIQQAYP